MKAVLLFESGTMEKDVFKSVKKYDFFVRG
jgi:hypothetical protein